MSAPSPTPSALRRSIRALLGFARTRRTTCAHTAAYGGVDGREMEDREGEGVGERGEEEEEEERGSFQ